MINLNKLEYNKIEIIESRFECENYPQCVVIKKTNCKGNNKDRNREQTKYYNTGLLYSV